MTDYPWQGRIEIVIEITPTDAWTLGLRVPGWCRSSSLTLGEVSQPADVVDGRLTIHRSWQAGDRVVLSLDMPARYSVADPRLDAARGCVAIERGPLVYCLEAADLPEGVAVDDVTIDTSQPPVPGAERDPVLGTLGLEVALLHRPIGLAGWPYRDRSGAVPSSPGPARPLSVRVHPYHAWANRGDGAMRVWIPTSIRPLGLASDDTPGESRQPVRTGYGGCIHRAR